MSEVTVKGVAEQTEAEHELISTSLDVEQLDTTLFRSKSLWIPTRARGAFGGQVISQALVSATNSVDPSYGLHSLHCYFLLSASASKPIIYYVERARQGRTYTTRSVKASQSGKLVFVMLCSFQKPELLQPSYQRSFPLDVPPPDSVQPEEVRHEELSRDDTLHPTMRRYCELYAQDRRRSPIEVRLATERTDKEGAYVIMWWMRARKARGAPSKYEQPFQKCILAYISDMQLISTPGRMLGLRSMNKPRQAMGGSLDHSIFFYNHDELDCSEWLLYVMTSPVVGHGRGVVLGQIFTQSGVLVAFTTQEGLVRVKPEVQPEDSTKARL